MSGPAVHTEYGDRDVAMSGEILRTLVGSGVHGIAIEATDDHDEMGVFIEPPQHVLGIDPPYDYYVFRTQPEGARSGPGDLEPGHVRGDGLGRLPDAGQVKRRAFSSH